MSQEPWLECKHDWNRLDWLKWSRRPWPVDTKSRPRRSSRPSGGCSSCRICPRGPMTRTCARYRPTWILIFGSKHQGFLVYFQFLLLSCIPRPRSGAPRTHSARPVGARLLLLLLYVYQMGGDRYVCYFADTSALTLRLKGERTRLLPDPAPRLRDLSRAPPTSMVLALSTQLQFVTTISYIYTTIM